MEIFFVRHGESVANQEKAYQGWTDINLSVQGLEQAKRLNEYFLTKNIKFTKIYSSPLKRALDTAKALIPSSIDSVIETRDALKSINVGRWSGISIQEAKNKQPQEHWKWKTLPEEFSFPNGESIHDVLLRAKPLILELTSEWYGKNNRIAIVTHMITIKVLALWMLRVDLNKIWEPQYTVPNTGMIVFVVQKGISDDTPQFERLNLEDPVPHLS
jgi:broad specificity phosphatase PhoE